MAERRMFSQQIVESDAFYDMPADSQALYLHLCMNADDDGFVNNPQRIRRMMGGSEDSLKILLAKRFVLPFESGVMVIKHWRMQNTLRKDRYKPTEYTEERGMLFLKSNGSYTFDDTQGALLFSIESKQDNENTTEIGLATKWQPNDNQRLPQNSIEKSKGGKLNNNINTTHACACAYAREDISVLDFETALDCLGWDKYPNGDVYAEIRDTLIELIDNGQIELSDITHKIIGEILDSMFVGRERRNIVDLRAYLLAIVQRHRKNEVSE